MNKVRIVLLAMILSCSPSLADTKADDKMYCGVLAQYAWLIITNRFERGIEYEKAFPTLARSNKIHPDMTGSINRLIDRVYEEDFPLIRDAASVALFTSEVNSACLKERKQQRD